MPTIRTAAAAVLAVAALTTAGCGGPDLAHAVEMGDYHAVVANLEDLPSPDVVVEVGGQQTTPLVAAARRGDEHLVERILELGGGPNFTAPDGVTPLMAACKAIMPTAARVLLKAGADPSRRTADGTTCISELSRVNGRTDWKSEIVDGAVARGLDLGKVRMPPSWPAPFGDLPALHYVALRGEAALVRTFLERGAPVDLRDAAGRTPLVAAVASSNPHSVRFLLEKGADGGAVDTAGRGVLAAATSYGDRDHGANRPRHVIPEYRAAIERTFAPENTTNQQRIAALDRAEREAKAASDSEAAARQKAENDALDREILRRAALKRDFEANQPTPKPAAAPDANLPELCFRPDIAACRAKGRSCNDCFHDTLPRPSAPKTSCLYNYEVCGSECCGAGYVCCISEDGDGAHCRTSRDGCKGWGTLRKKDYDAGMRRSP